MGLHKSFKKFIIFIPIALSVGAMQVQAGMLTLPLLPTFEQSAEQNTVLATRSLSLENRHAVPYVNEVFADNILLTLSYMSGRISHPDQINWDIVRQPQEHEIVLKSGEVFAYHDGVMSQYSQDVVDHTQ
jgi:hypothetical protein